MEVAIMEVASTDGDDAVEAVAVVAVDRENDEAILEDLTENPEFDDEDDDEEPEADEVHSRSSLGDMDNISASSPRKRENVDEASTATPTVSGKKRRYSMGHVTNRKGRTPSVAGLAIPFRTVKKAMKLDPDTPIVQNEAAIAVTMATELFLTKLSQDSFRNAKSRGRNTIRYEDIAEARTMKSSLSFLETLLP